jgi:hypothetical protein
MILIAARHATPVTCTPRDKQTRFSKPNKDKRKNKTKQTYPGFEFKPRQVNDSSQSNQGTDHLVSYQPKLTTHPIQSHPSTPREKWREKPSSRERKLLFACFVAMLVTWMSFTSGARELGRDALTSYRDEFIDFSPCSYFHALPRISSRALSRFSHGSNHRSYGFGSWESSFLPRHFGYGPRPHRGDRFPRRPGFSARASHTHFESKHLDGPHFPRHGSHLTGPNDEVERTVKTSSGRMVKFWILKIYLTNPSTKPSISSHPM